MDGIQYQLTKGEAYYGNGEVRDFSIRSGHIVAEVGDSFDVDALTQAQVNTLIEAAREHLRKNGNQDNKVKIFEFQRKKGPTEITTKYV